MFNLLFIILTLPLVQKLYRVLACHGVSVSIWKRMVVGMIMSSLALVAGGLLETFRLQDIKDHGINQQIIGKPSLYTSPLYQLLSIPLHSINSSLYLSTLSTPLYTCPLYQLLLSIPLLSVHSLSLYLSSLSTPSLYTSPLYQLLLSIPPLSVHSFPPYLSTLSTRFLHTSPL